MQSLPARHKGLALSTILLAVILFAAIAVAIAMSSRTATGNLSNATAQSYAASIIQQGENYKMAFNRVMAGGVDIDHIIFDESPDTGVQAGIYNPVTGAPEQIPIPDALAYSGAIWVFRWNPGDPNSLIRLMNVGTATGPEHVIAIGAVKKEVCQQINFKLLGTTSIQTLGPGGTASNLSIWPPPPIDLSADPATNGHPSACVETFDQPGNYFYYTTLLES